MHEVSHRPVYRVQADGCTMLTTLWKHWPCLFPQHGRGRKHERTIYLAPWQQALVDEDPRPLIRGLLHSDGCRSLNTVRHELSTGQMSYSYPRYFFTNESAQIRDILTAALDQLGVAWRQNRRDSVSVARREAVAALDEFVGPKS